MDKGRLHPLMMLRRNTGEKFSDLQEEHRANKDRKSTFELSKLTGRAVAVQVMDSAWKTPEGEKQGIHPRELRQSVLSEGHDRQHPKTNEPKKEKEVSR